MSEPVRITLSRKRGFNLMRESIALNGLAAVNVARPGKWGNPWKFGDNMFDETEPGVYIWRKVLCAADAVKAFRNSVDWDPDAPYSVGDLVCWGGYGPEHRNRKTAIAELRSKNLACWCKPGEPCHADVLLELANSPARPVSRGGGE